MFDFDPELFAKTAEFAKKACASKATISIKITETLDLVSALAESLETQRGFASAEAQSKAQKGLALACPRCGPFTSEAVAVAMMSAPGGAFGAGAVLGGPNVAALYQGRCPGCNADTVNATFDPKGVGG